MKTKSDTRFPWVPDQATVENSRLTAFLRFAGAEDYDALARRAADDPGWLWDQVIGFADLRFYRPYDRIMDASRGPEWTRWCVGGTTNMVLNCIDRHRNSRVYDKTFLIWEGEQGDTREYSYRQFDEEVCAFAHGLRQCGFGKGDVIGLYLPQVPEAYIAYFAIVKIGAIAMPLFSGFGGPAVAERLSLAGASGLVTIDGTLRRGKVIAMKDGLGEALEQVTSLRHVITVSYLGLKCTWQEGRDLWWHDLVTEKTTDVATEEMNAEDPSVLHFTSGTTGKPKGAVYTHIGLVAKMALDTGILADFRDTDRHFCMADMGWMVGSMSAATPTVHGGSMVIAEGVPDYPDPDRYWRLIEKHGVTWVMLAPSLIRAQMRYGDHHVASRDLRSLRIVCSGGEPWTESPWRWLFEVVGKRRVPILNTSGGTEVSGCILACSLHHPLKVGSFSLAVPGMGADIVDESGQPTKVGETGELVLRHSSIGLTKSLWRDDTRYLESYWQDIPGVWRHGDLARRDADGHWYIPGRSDDTLKVSGKRLGPAEVENIVMQTGKVSEVAVVGVPDALKGSTILIACALMPEVEPGDSLSAELVRAVAENLGPAFRPEKVLFVEDLPKTRSMKIMRRAVRAAITGEEVGDMSSLTNPESLDAIRSAAAKAGLSPSAAAC